MATSNRIKKEFKKYLNLIKSLKNSKITNFWEVPK
jgi:hypothetical protein